MDPMIEMDEILAARIERARQRDYEEYERSYKPAMTCGGVGVNYSISPDGRIKFG